MVPTHTLSSLKKKFKNRVNEVKSLHFNSSMVFVPPQKKSNFFNLSCACSYSSLLITKFLAPPCRIRWCWQIPHSQLKIQFCFYFLILEYMDFNGIDKLCWCVLLYLEKSNVASFDWRV